MNNQTELERLIALGEGENFEFKSSFNIEYIRSCEPKYNIILAIT